MMENKKNIFILFLGWSGLTILLSAFFLTLFGMVDITVSEYKEIPMIMDFFIHQIALFFNIVIIMSFSYNNKFGICVSKSFVIVLFVVASYYVLTQSYALISSTFLPFTLILIFNFKDYKKHLLHISFCCITFLFQYIFRYIKMKVFNIDYSFLNAITLLILSLDLFLYYFWMLKVVKSDARLVGRMFRSVPKRKHIRQDSENASGLTEKQQAVKRLIMLIYFSFQIGLLILIGRLNQTTIEMILLLAMFIIGRQILGTSWHSNSLKVCFSISTISFYVLSKAVLPISVSLFMVVVASGAFIYLMHILGVKADRLEALEKRVPELEEMINPEMVLRRKCKDLKMSHQLTEITVERDIYGLSVKEQAIKYSLSIDTIKYYRKLANRHLKSASDTDIIKPESVQTV